MKVLITRYWQCIIAFIFCYTKFTKYISYWRNFSIICFFLFNTLTFLGSNFLFMYFWTMLSVALRFCRIFFVIWHSIRQGYCYNCSIWEKLLKVIFAIIIIFPAWFLVWVNLMCCFQVEQFVILIDIWYICFNGSINKTNTFLNIVFN